MAKTAAHASNNLTAEVRAKTGKGASRQARRNIQHVDLIIVRRGERVTVEIQVIVEGDAGPDTLVNQESNTIEIESDAMSIPENLHLSVEGIAAGTQFLASQIPLPDGVTLI